jgi:hypothetical protein
MWLKGTAPGRDWLEAAVLAGYVPHVEALAAGVLPVSPGNGRGLW